MKPTEDRRNPHVRRVPLVALVDICQAEGEGSPFQAHAANVSGRGMHVRTGHLPELGEELVCRFEHDDREILVEGRVAWRSEGGDGGEFGIQFTALDAGSADILRQLGQGQPQALDELAEDDAQQEGASPVRLELAQGQRVRLHMDGLGAPMKASVHAGGPRRIRVGSGLEFLKVGRSLEVEEVDGGARRGARVDSVNVIINPQTSVPELVVQLRYEGISDTPPPAEVDDPKADGGVQDDGAEASMEEDGAWESVDALSERLKGLVDRVSVVAQAAGSRLGGVVSTVASSGRGASRKKRRVQTSVSPPMPSEAPSRKRRVQRPVRPSGATPSHLRSGIHDLKLTGHQRASVRPSTRAASEAKAGKSTRTRLFLVLGVLALSLGSAVALRNTLAATGAKEEGQLKEAKAAATQTPKQAPPPEVVKKESPPTSPEGIVADVPFFGQRTVAAQEPDTGEKEVDVEEAERLAAAAAVPDETWEDAKLSAEKPAESEPWGRGRLHLPTIHRIRLDGEGGKLSGAVEPNGFVVVIPGRKAMESGRGIQKRDKRIASVTASNTDGGAKLRFQFRGPVPPYRVRLRKDFVEFLISAPEDGVAAL